jgi:hypothetical protein
VLYLRGGCSHAHLIRRRLDEGGAVSRNSHARLAGKAIHGIVRGRDALPDEPVAIALRPRLSLPAAPAESRRTALVRLIQVTAGKLRPIARVRRGFVDSANLDRIDTQLVRQLVDGRLQGKCADRLARRAHPGIRDRVEVDNLLADEEMFGGI